MDDSICLLRRLLGSGGDPARERVFRMNVTTCIHRALRPDEVEALPEWFHEAEPLDLAGGPVEILWENEEGLVTTRPCQSPIRHYLFEDPLLWVPIDCERCGPCLARLALVAQRGRAAITSR